MGGNNQSYSIYRLLLRTSGRVSSTVDFEDNFADIDLKFGISVVVGKRLLLQAKELGMDIVGIR